jgi:uncharacterized protein
MRELPPYPASTLFVVEVGSGAHGTGLAGREDHDEMVVYAETPGQVFGVRNAPRGAQVRTKPVGVPSEPGDTDRNLYSLRHFLYLAAAGNPSIMMAFWAPVIHSTPLGNKILATGPEFVGRHLVEKYRGYMKAQKDRLLGLRGGRHGQLRETDAGFDTKYAMHAARLGFQGVELLTNRKLMLPIPGTAGRWLKDVRKGKIPLDDVIRRIDGLDRVLAEMQHFESIPAHPDWGAIATSSVVWHKEAWGW